MERTWIHVNPMNHVQFICKDMKYVWLVFRHHHNILCWSMPRIQQATYMFRNVDKGRFKSMHCKRFPLRCSLRLPDAKVSNSIYLSTTTSSSTWPEVGKLLPGINYTRSRLRVFSKLKHRTGVSSEVLWDHHTWHTYSSIYVWGHSRYPWYTH